MLLHIILVDKFIGHFIYTQNLYNKLIVNWIDIVTIQEVTEHAVIN